MSHQTAAERKAAERKRKKEKGLAEVRGIWAKPEQHSLIKDRVKLLVSVCDKSQKNA